MIAVRQLAMQRGGRWLLRDINLQLPRGRIVGLLGPPEAGKSMLLKALAGLQEVQGGHIDTDGGAPLQRIGFAFQNNALFDDLTVFDNVALPLRHAGVAEPECRERVDARLQDVQLFEARQQFPKALSGGMQKRLGVARATIAEPQLGLFDEPTAGLDPQTTGRIFELLQRLTTALQMATLIVSQDLPALLPFCERVVMLHAGRQVFYGPPQALPDEPHPVVRQFILGAATGPL